MKMQCNEVQAKLGGFLDGALPDHESGQVAEHLERCEDCRAMFQHERQLADAITELPHVTCPDRVVQGIEEATAIQHHGSTLKEKLRSMADGFRWRWASAALTIATATILVAVLYPRDQTSDPMPPILTEEEIQKGRKQASWALSYVAHTINDAQENAVDDLLRKDLPRMVRGRLKDAVRTTEGG